MVGDDLEFDVRPAKALGMRAAWIRETATEEGDLADVAFPSIRILVDHWENTL
jgi:FMN phosphatase YigB (HAD superfamily)